MSGMPYHLEKGPIISVLEAFANGTAKQLGVALTKLRNGDPLVEIGVVDSKTLHSKTFAYQWLLVHHINKHWLGMTKTNGAWARQPAFDPNHPATTGHWQHYHGPVEKILRETFIRAAEVSLGLDHDQKPVPATPVRHWPVEFFWKCPQPWFEGWVTWRRSAGGDGQVTVILATPADTGVVLDSPVKGRNCQVNPTTTKPVHPTTKKAKESHQGMWVVTAKQHKQYLASTTAPSPSGQVTLPGSVWCGEQGVVTVAPHFYDGGASPDGLGYTPGWKP